MKFNFMGYDVEIKAKNSLLSSRNNADDTKAVINTIICLMWDSAYKSQMQAEIAESLGQLDKMKIHLDYKSVIEKYAHQASNDYEKL